MTVYADAVMSMGMMWFQGRSWFVYSDIAVRRLVGGICVRFVSKVDIVPNDAACKERRDYEEVQ